MSAPVDNRVAAQLAETIRGVLTASQRSKLGGEVSQAAALIAELLAGERTSEQLERDLRAVDLSGLRTALKGQSLQVDGRKVIDFGSAKIDSASFGDVVQGDMVKLNVTITQAPAHRPSYEEQLAATNRERLIDAVRRFWVDGVLNEGLHQRVLIELGMQTRPDTLDQPWKKIVHRREQAPQPLPVGTPIVDLFEGAHGRLLILGAPGGGKTTTLLLLADELLRRAVADVLLSIPVVFQLSTWAQTRLRLADWLVIELKERYGVPLKVGTLWVSQGQILPLLDGLDEVGPGDADRAACVAAINAYLSDTGAQAVVCSRSAEYVKQGAQLGLDTAIEIVPLETPQIDGYLAQFGAPLESLRQAVARDTTLGELVRSPLLLNVMALTYSDVEADDLVDQDQTTIYQRLWADYLQRRMGIKRGDAKTDARRLKAWLIWLARGMQAHGQQVFYIEYLQPSWLATKDQRRMFHVTSGLVVGLVGVLAEVLVGSLVVGLTLGLVLGLVFGFSGVTLTETLSWDWRRVLSWPQFRTGLVVGLGVGLVAGLGIGLVAGLVVGLVVGLVAGLVFGLVFGLVVVLFFGLNFRQVFSMLQDGELQISTRPNEGIRRSQRSMILGGLFYGLAGGLVLGLLGSPIYGLVGGLVFGLVRYGGTAVVKHYVLRLLLRHRCHTPWNFAKPLNEAVSRTLMTRVGGGYRFYHRLLQEHLAKHEVSELPVAAILGPNSGDYTGGRRARG